MIKYIQITAPITVIADVTVVYEYDPGDRDHPKELCITGVTHNGVNIIHELSDEQYDEISRLMEGQA